MKAKKSAVFILMAVMVLCTAARGNAGEKTHTLTMAHRCGQGIADENTLHACELAAFYGMDFIECDPRMTKDGVFILMHDETVDRTTDGSGLVADMTLEQIKKLKTTGGHRAPTLEEMLVLADSLGIGVYMDTKFHDTQTLQKMIELIISKDLGNDLLIGLWKQEQQVWIEQNYPEFRTCIAWPAPVPSVKQISELGAECMGMVVDSNNEKTVKQAHRLGMIVKSAPVNDVALIKKKYDFGVDILQADDPILLGTVLSVLEHSGDRTDTEDSLLPYEIKNQKLSDEMRNSISETLPEKSRLVQRLVFVGGHCDAPDKESDQTGSGHGSYANPIPIAVNPDTPAHFVGYGTMIYVPDVGWAKAAAYCNACVRDAAMNTRIELCAKTGGDETQAAGWRWAYFEDKAGAE